MENSNKLVNIRQLYSGGVIMLVIERTEIDGRFFTYTYSSIGMKIERDGILYDEAYDPEEFHRTYTETDTPIEHDEDEDAAYAEAGRILMGVM